MLLLIAGMGQEKNVVYLGFCESMCGLGFFVCLVLVNSLTIYAFLCTVSCCNLLRFRGVSV